MTRTLKLVRATVGLAVTMTLAIVAAHPAGAAAHTSAPAGTCFGHAPTIRGTSGSNEIVATQGPDVIVAGAGNDTITALGGNDVICGPDRLYGQRGNDTLTGDTPPVDSDVRDICRGGAGRDRLYFC
jgi:Ca2+-binding RTX toxin-like protein